MGDEPAAEGQKSWSWRQAEGPALGRPGQDDPDVGIRWRRLIGELGDEFSRSRVYPRHLCNHLGARWRLGQSSRLDFTCL